MESKSCHFSLSFNDFRFQHVHPDEHMHGEPSEHRQMWLSWSIFSESYASALPHAIGTSGSIDIPSIIHDTFDIEYSYRNDSVKAFIPSEIVYNFPLKIYLCCNDNATDHAQAESSQSDQHRILAMALYDPFSSIVKTRGNAGLYMPIKHDEWVSFEPVEQEDGFLQAGMRISITISLPCDNQPAVQEATIEPAYKAPRSPAVRIQEPLPLHMDVQSEHQLRHYRLSIELHSISGLKRPGPLLFQFHYPYFGTRSVFRSKQHYYAAEVEGRVPQGAVSFQFCSSRARLLELLSSKPLVIHAHQRSVMGSAVLGQVVLDLSHVMHSSPHSYRCPTSSKSFRRLEDYLIHRDMLTHLADSPSSSTEPIAVYALDSSCSFVDPTPTSSTPSASSGMQNAKLRVVVIMEDICAVGPEIGVPVQAGYKMQNGGLYRLPDEMGEGDDGEDPPPPPPLPAHEMSGKELERLRQDWEAWRAEAEQRWREALHAKEQQLRTRLQKEQAHLTESMVDDLRRAQQEVGRMEVKLKAALEEVERQKMQLGLQEEQMRLRIANKTHALSTLHHRIKADAKMQVDQEKQNSQGLQRQVEQLQQACKHAEQRALQADAEVQQMKLQLRQAPETALQQEVVRLQTLLAESKLQVEKERKLQAEARLDQEHMRGQVYRLANALKREREKISLVAKQELEQLRLEFLAREERFMLDGDRDLLQTIRGELSTLRTQHPHSSTASPSSMQISTQHMQQQHQQQHMQQQQQHMQQHQYQQQQYACEDEAGLLPQVQRIREEIARLRATGCFDDSDPLIMELKNMATVAANDESKSHTY